MDTQLFDRYFTAYKEKGSYALRQPRPLKQMNFIANGLLFFISLGFLPLLSWYKLSIIVATVSFLNCLSVLIGRNASPCIITPHKIFFAPSLWNKGPWLYWHEIEHITIFPTSVRLIPHKQSPFLNHMNFFRRSFYPFFWKITKQEPHLTLQPLFKINTSELGELLIAFKNEHIASLIAHPKLVIFDCDGVLVDSEIISYEVYARIFGQLGYQTSGEELLKKLSGFSIANMIEAVSKELSTPLSIDSLTQTIQKEIELVFAQSLKPIPGIENLLTRLQEKGIPFCLVSNGLSERLTVALEASGLAHFFTQEKRIDVSSVERGKPSPDLFLYAAEKFETAPTDCLVIEDSATGINAAHAADMPVIGLLAGSHAQHDWYQKRIKTAAPTRIAPHVQDVIALLD